MSELPKRSAPRMVEEVLQRIGAAVALANPDSWEIEFENASFFDWFPSIEDGMDTLLERIPGIDPEKAERRFDRGRGYQVDSEVRKGARTIAIVVSLKRVEIAEEPLILVEAVNISKQKEAEFMLDSYSRMSEKNARELQKEKDRVEKLLLNIMPRTVFEEIRNYGTSTPQRFDAATILLLDFVGFTEMAIAGDPGAVVAELNDIFSAFDRIVDLFECERIKTIGDAYLAVSGLPEATEDHAMNVARVALRMKRYLDRRNSSHPTQWYCRIGIATGPVVGSIVGIQKYVYDIFGPGVNLAARLEGLCEPMQILVNEEAFELIGDGFVFTELDEVDVKGFGSQRVFSLDREINETRGGR